MIIHVIITVCSLQPSNATRITASGIENRVKKLQEENGTVNKKVGFCEEFEVRYEDFLFL